MDIYHLIGYYISFPLILLNLLLLTLSLYFVRSD